MPQIGRQYAIFWVLVFGGLANCLIDNELQNGSKLAYLRPTIHLRTSTRFSEGLL
jgi:hypothetical protein